MLIRVRILKFVSFLCGKKNSCGNKIDYKSQSSANKASVSFGNKVKREFEAYNCWFCDGWHIGGAQKLTVKKFCRIFWFWLKGA
jgi:hypothetical protein